LDRRNKISCRGETVQKELRNIKIEDRQNVNPPELQKYLNKV